MSKKYFEPMHTAEHILNQVMLRLHTGERSITTHIERKKSKVDFYFSRDLTGSEISFIEEKVNSVITDEIDVKERFLAYEEAKNNYDLSRLPKSSGNKIRIIDIGSFDSCPCIGQHVGNTREIDKFTILSTSYNAGILRIRFKLIKK